MQPLPIVDSSPEIAPSRSPGNAAAKGRYSFVSLGCPKNLVDSERMLGLLQLDGYQLVGNPEDADFVVVNTCGFIERAREESFGAIHEMLELKRRGAIKGVIVSGCLAEREKESLLETCPEIDHLVGVFGREHVTKVADRMLGGLVEQRSVFQPAPSRPLPDTARLRITPRHFAFLKISEGCDRLCTFCAIPKMRGKHATKPIEEVLAEARELAADGVRELNIVAQDTTYYGLDLYGRPRLAELLAQLDQIEGLDWIRIMYLYPMYFTDELIEVLAKSKRIVPYLDLPLQHINDVMLKRMQRRVTRAETDSFPPGPFAYRVYVVELDGVTCSDPFGCWISVVSVLFPFASMVISFAFAVSHVRVADCPCSITWGLTVREAVGAAGSGGGGTLEATVALWHALSITAAPSVRISVTRIIACFILSKSLHELVMQTS